MRIYIPLSEYSPFCILHTVNPFDSVVLSVVAPMLTGVAKPLVTDWMERKAERVRTACFKFRASRRDAMVRLCWQERQREGVGANLYLGQLRSNLPGIKRKGEYGQDLVSKYRE